jgi:DNA-binding transcriptional LysR family regulator
MGIGQSDLLLLVAIADRGSLTGAARQLGVQKSTVSRDLAILETRLGHRLVERTTRQLRLTEAGELLLGFAQRVSEEIEAAGAAMEALSSEPSGSLHVSAPHVVIQSLLLPMLQDFITRFPRIRVALDATTRPVNLVGEGIDVALRAGRLPDLDLVARQIGAFPIILVAAPDYLARAGRPCHAAELRDHAVIGIGSCVQETIWTFAPGGERIVLHPAIHVSGTELACRLAITGAGIAAVPLPIASDSLIQGCLVRVLPELTAGNVPLQALFASRRFLAPKIRVFIDAVAHEVARKGWTQAKPA